MAIDWANSALSFRTLSMTAALTKQLRNPGIVFRRGSLVRAPGCVSLATKSRKVSVNVWLRPLKSSSSDCRSRWLSRRSSTSCWIELEVSENGGTPKSSILIGFDTKNHPFWGTPILGKPQLASSRISSAASWQPVFGSVDWDVGSQADCCNPSRVSAWLPETPRHSTTPCLIGRNLKTQGRTIHAPCPESSVDWGEWGAQGRRRGLQGRERQHLRHGSSSNGMENGVETTNQFLYDYHWYINMIFIS